MLINLFNNFIVWVIYMFKKKVLKKEKWSWQEVKN